jgi:hypothetical protein
MRPERLIFIGGLVHFGILLASAMVPRVLDWRTSLRKLDGLSRQLVWVHGLFIVSQSCSRPSWQAEPDWHGRFASSLASFGHLG